jgi:SAM-dependent methyltransferase
MAVNPKQFWEAKLLAWEQGRYGGPDRPRDLLKWIANRSSMSLRFRVAITFELLRPYLANKRVVELGCGCGIMARKLIEYGAASYLGIDIAESAVETARARYGDNPKVWFLASSVAEMQPLSADLVISLGCSTGSRTTKLSICSASQALQTFSTPLPNGSAGSSNGFIAPMSTSHMNIAPIATAHAIQMRSCHTAGRGGY